MRPESCDSPSSPEPAASWFGGAGVRWCRSWTRSTTGYRPASFRDARVGWGWYRWCCGVFQGDARGKDRAPFQGSDWLGWLDPGCCPGFDRARRWRLRAERGGGRGRHSGGVARGRAQPPATGRHPAGMRVFVGVGTGGVALLTTGYKPEPLAGVLCYSAGNRGFREWIAEPPVIGRSPLRDGVC